MMNNALRESYTSASQPRERVRLTPARHDQDLYPWQRADQLTRCFLYWMPVHTFPIPMGQRQWLSSFLDRVAALLGTEYQLRPEVFLQYKTVQTVDKAFRRTANDFMPLIGLSRRPGASMPPSPTKEDITSALNSGKDFDWKDWAPDYCFWFLNKAEKKQRDEFAGYGGLSMVFLKPDPNTIPTKLPLSEKARRKLEVFQISRLEALMAAGSATQDGFLAKSKALFGAGLETEPEFEGIPYVLPLLGCQEFVNQPDAECDKWFQLFDVYIRESVEDGGVLLASGTDFEASLIELLKQMRQEGWEYPER